MTSMFISFGKHRDYLNYILRILFIVTSNKKKSKYRYVQKIEKLTKRTENAKLPRA